MKKILETEIRLLEFTWKFWWEERETDNNCDESVEETEESV